MSSGTDLDAGAEGSSPRSLLEALLVYAEPLASGAHVIVIGASDGVVADRLLDVGARSVHVFDPDAARAARAARTAPRGVTVRPLGAELDVRDGAFDLAVVPDLAELADARAAVAQLRRALAARGAIVAMGRARLDAEDTEAVPPFATELGPASLAYADLYDLFASELEDIALVGVVPFQGVVFAELGTEDEAPAVSVDTRLAPSEPPSVFVVVASGSRAEAGARSYARPELDPYAIVQIPPDERIAHEEAAALEAGFANATMKAEMLAGQVEELRQQLLLSEMRTVEAATHLERTAAERDAALTRAMELEAVLAASQQAMAMLERRLLEAERGCLERDDRLAALSAELDSRDSAQPEAPSPELVQLVDELKARADRAEATAAARADELAHIGEAHGAETSAFEAQLAERARLVSELEKELVRREHLVKELVASLEEAREGASPGPVFEVAAPLLAPPPRRAAAEAATGEELTRLRRKLDELAAEVARREGELTARAWRIQELENALQQKAKPEVARAEGQPDAALRKALDEVDALRTALAQEHEARLAAESGEELARARSELARQATLLEQMRSRVESA